MDPQQQKFDENQIKAKIDKDLKNMSTFKDMFTKLSKIENGMEFKAYVFMSNCFIINKKKIANLYFSNVILESSNSKQSAFNLINTINT